MVHDYNRAKYFKQKFGHFELFQPIFKTIEQDISQLTEILFKKLSFNTNTDIDNLLNNHVNRMYTSSSMVSSSSEDSSNDALGIDGGRYVGVGMSSSVGVGVGMSSSVGVGVGCCEGGGGQCGGDIEESSIIGSSSSSSTGSFKLLNDYQERMIGFLNNLESKQDPAWYYLEKMHTFIKDTLQRCLDTYEKNTRDISDLIEQEELFEMNHNHPSFMSEEDDIASTQCYTSFFRQLLERKTVDLVIDLTNILLKTIPDFWQLSQNILIGKYLPKKKRIKKESENDEKEKQIVNLMRDITLKYSDIVNTAIEMVDNHSAHQKSLSQCVCEIIRCNEQLNQLKIPKKYISHFDEFTDLMTRYMVHEIWNRTIGEVSRFYVLEKWKPISETLTITELPLKFQDFIIKTLSLLRPLVSKGNVFKQDLVSEIEKHFMQCLKVFADNYHELSFNEEELSRKQSMSGKYRFSVHNFNKIEERDSRLLLTLSNCSHTKNVILYNVLSAFVAGFKLHPSAVTHPFSSTSSNNSNSTTTMTTTTTKITTTTTGTTSTTSKISTTGKQTFHDDDSFDNTIQEEEDDDSDKSEEARSSKNLSKNLLSEMDLSFRVTSKDLQTHTMTFMKQDSIQQVFHVYDTLIDLLINDFVRKKSHAFMKRIEKGLILSGYDWKRSPTPTSVRSYILDLLLELSMVHAKTEKITSVTIGSDFYKTGSIFNDMNSLDVKREFTSKIFSLLTERLAEIFLYHAKSIEEMGENAALQLDIDVSFLRKALESFETSRAKQIFKKLNKHLSQVTRFSSSTEQLKASIIHDMAEKTYTQLDCFNIHVESSLNLLSISTSFKLLNRSTAHE